MTALFSPVLTPGRGAHLKTWHLENLVVAAFLAGVFWWEALPVNAKTVAWAVGALVAHSARSHANRKAEKAGQPHDWLQDAFVWAGAGAAILGAEAGTQALLLPVLVLQVLFTLHRYAYRHWLKPLPRPEPAVDEWGRRASGRFL